jgi:hypothetical protein
MDFQGMTMAWHGNVWKWHVKSNGMEMACHAMTWKGMTMAWHGINGFVGLGLGGSFVSLCALTQKFGRNVQ